MKLISNQMKTQWSRNILISYLEIKILQLNFSLPHHNDWITISIHIQNTKQNPPSSSSYFFNLMSCRKKPAKRGQVHQIGGRARYWFRWDFLARFSNHLQSNTSCRWKNKKRTQECVFWEIELDSCRSKAIFVN